MSLGKKNPEPLSKNLAKMHLSSNFKYMALLSKYYHYQTWIFNTGTFEYGIGTTCNMLAKNNSFAQAH